MVNYQKVRVKITNKQLNKLKFAARNKKAVILRLNKKTFEDRELPNELFVTTRQTIKICNVIANNTSTDIKPSKDKMLKFSQGNVAVL